ncbi:elongator complex protein 3 [Patescibacteria group bacterium]
MNQSDLIIKLAKATKLDRKSIEQFKRAYAKESSQACPTNMQLLAIYRSLVQNNTIKPNQVLERLLCTRAIRTLSGVAVISVLMKPHPCPGDCLFCPTDKTVPKSYSPNEPAVMRALLCDFDPYRQVQARIKSLQKTGHDTSKCELIIIGATFLAYPKQYQTWFLKRCFEGFSNSKYSTLPKAQKANEKAGNRCIGISVETRPDTIDHQAIARLRELGVTRIELGVQHIDDEVLTKNKRGHSVQATIHATQLLKDAGFKINYHMMPGLYGSSDKKDLDMFREIFQNPAYQPDMLKIYPCIVTRNSKLYRLWKQKKYRALSTKRLTKLLVKIKAHIPRYVRIVRLIRDIPAHEIAGGSDVTNLRQTMQHAGVKCNCIRCREAKEQPAKLADTKLFIEKYAASGGTEYFLSFESKDRKTLFAFLRLRFPGKTFLPELKDSALIREVHTYGLVVPVGRQQKKATQHLGLGRRLMAEAETLAKKHGYAKMSVISGIGVRGYYRKLGYRLRGTYMIKILR